MLWIGLLRLTVILLVIVINKGASGAVMNNEELTNVITKLEKTIEVDQLEKRRFEAAISNLQFELESVKNKSETNEKIIEEEQMNMNQTKVQTIWFPSDVLMHNSTIELWS
jgi:peptidoglycan hydrolase CwlO-like protein